MIEIKKCHVCGSENIVKNVASTANPSECSPMRLFYVEDGKRAKKCRLLVRAAICQDCGTVRLYVEEGKKNWVDLDEYRQQLYGK